MQLNAKKKMMTKQVSLTDHAGTMTACSYPNDVGDDFCDDVTNIDECNFDGGDCCSSKKHLTPNPHLFCSDCHCKGQKKKVRIKPGNQRSLISALI